MSDDTHPSGDTGVSGWWQRLVQGRAGDVKTRDDIAEFLETFRERGIVGADEFAMLQGVLEVADTQVRDIMVPRSQMVVVAKDQTPEEVLKVIAESNHSRFPVIGDDKDEVVGRGDPDGYGHAFYWHPSMGRWAQPLPIVKGYRYCTANAMSRGVPFRRRRVRSTIASRSSGVLSKNSLMNGVSIAPGLTPLTRTFGPTSAASDFVIWVSAALAHSYTR